ncbi:helix-turn-helix domain-containing protein [Pyrobaculum sp. 3827-6]|uniref:helix-turn-helix domain-containing protein n=1 Tax=Pyrobaculum sp. 3827-6 TaxID=2983604 RepID=UPI0021D8A730|nr:helix-turn-helix domain-containing protein [Pyrobaculum sp. 3827-6]MCU7787100.1 helix-turn-helix domain-containing protein [Pyrobaculum sp. 3827-6]
MFVNPYWAKLSDEQKIGVVRCLRETLGLSVSDIARMAGVTPAAVVQWLSGRSTPTPEKLQKMHETDPLTVEKCLPAPPVTQLEIDIALETLARALRDKSLREYVTTRLAQLLPGLKIEIAYTATANDVELFRQKLVAENLTGDTVNRYIRYLVRFLQHVGWSLTPESLQSVYTYSDSYKIRRETIIALKRFIDLVVKAREPQIAPILYDAVKTPPVKKNKNGFRLPTIEEVRRVWEEAHKISPCAAAVWGIMAETGVRFDHLHRAAITGLQLDKRRLLLGETDGPKKQPLIFLTEGAVRYLKEVYLPWREAHHARGDKLFPCKEHTLYEWLKEARERAGLPWLEPRLLRKFHAQWLLDRGVDVADIALLQGRSLPGGLAVTIEHYIQDYERRLRTVFEKYTPRLFS